MRYLIRQNKKPKKEKDIYLVEIEIKLNEEILINLNKIKNKIFKCCGLNFDIENIASEIIKSKFYNKKEVK